MTENVQYVEIATEMNLMIEDEPSKEHQIRKVHSFEYENINGIRKNFAVVEIDERFYQEAMMRILEKKK